MKGIKWIVWVLAAAMLFTACSITPGSTEPTDESLPDPENDLAGYIKWFGLPYSQALEDLGIPGDTVTAAEYIPTGKRVTYQGYEFELALLTVEELDYCVKGVELKAEMGDGAIDDPDAVWDLLQKMDSDCVFYTDSKHNIFVDFKGEYTPLMKQAEYYKNLDKALRIRGVYSFDIRWDILYKAPRQMKDLLEQMKQLVKAEIESQPQVFEPDFVWTVDTGLEVQLKVNIYDQTKGDITLVCAAMAEPAGGIDTSLELRERDKKFCGDAFKGLLAQDYLHVVGYGFRTLDGEQIESYEDIYLCGEDYVSVVDCNGVQTVLICLDGKQYASRLFKGEYSEWKLQQEPAAHPLPWIEITAEELLDGGSCGGASGSFGDNVFTGSFSITGDSYFSDFLVEANNVYKVEYRIPELSPTGTETTVYRRILEIAPVTEEEAAQVIASYKALLP